MTSFAAIAVRFEHAVHTEHREHGDLRRRVSKSSGSNPTPRTTRGRPADIGIQAGAARLTSCGSRATCMPTPSGFSLLSIYQRYLDEGESLVEPILDLLRAGRSSRQSCSPWGWISTIRTSGTPRSTSSTSWWQRPSRWRSAMTRGCARTSSSDERTPRRAGGRSRRRHAAQADGTAARRPDGRRRAGPSLRR